MPRAFGEARAEKVVTSVQAPCRFFLTGEVCHNNHGSSVVAFHTEQFILIEPFSKRFPATGGIKLKVSDMKCFEIG
jgi:hypothetical protein